MRSHEISNRLPEKFVRCRVGVDFKSYQEELEDLIDTLIQREDGADFIVTPIAPPQPIYYEEHRELELLPDLVLPARYWEQHAAVSVNNHAKLDKLLKHALYLSTPVIVIDCPESDDDQQSVAAIVNEIMRDNTSERLVLFRLPLDCKSKSNSPSNSPRSPPTRSRRSRARKNRRSTHQFQSTSNLSEYLTDDSGVSNSSAAQSLTQDDWNKWNNFRSLLAPDHRIGVCLAIHDNLETDAKELARWSGETVRMISLDVDRFSSTKGFANTMRPHGNIREFMRTVALANSLNISFVVEARDSVNILEHIKCLVKFCDMLSNEHRDPLRAWNDKPLSPLQPLSSNLDSCTYQIFENDSAKYDNYQQAMVQALDALMKSPNSMGRNRFVAMVLGAGRGPLVDAMIKAIRQMNLYSVQFQIYALDKNYSSIQSLKYKKRRYWNAYLPNIQIEVIEADMRIWEPSEKADIIATELLGSFSDNELSPECIDGTWRFATSSTICIPQSYSSFIAPICSYRMLQEFYKSRFFISKFNAFDQLQVVRLANFYPISEPKELFSFDHKDISRRPVEGANRRESTLAFKSNVDTVCHGFAGYFSARLFGSVTISTIPSIKTPEMESWFSAFIPLEKPIQMPAGTCLEATFYRKESADKVWYEWFVEKPEKSRIHSLDGNGTAMSKMI